MLGDNQHSIECLKQLKGIKNIILGNHDSRIRRELYQEIGNVIGYADLIKIGKHRFYLSHYPSFTSNLEDNLHPSERIYCLHGHTHQLTNFYQNIPWMYHCGLDSHGCYPISIDTIIMDIKNKMQKYQISFL